MATRCFASIRSRRSSSIWRGSGRSRCGGRRDDFRAAATCKAETTDEGYKQGKLGTLHRCSVTTFVDGQKWVAGVAIDTLTKKKTVFAGASDLVTIDTPPSEGNVFQPTNFEGKE